MYARIGTKSYTFASQFQVKQQNKGAFINNVDQIFTIIDQLPTPVDINFFKVNFIN